MPDASLFKPLCEELGITVNDLISGEEIDNKDYKEKSEENIIKTIDYSNKKINERSNIIYISLIVIGIVFSIIMNLGINPFKGDEIGSVIGSMFVVIGLSKLTRTKSYYKRLVIVFIFFALYLLLLYLISKVS